METGHGFWEIVVGGEVGGVREGRIDDERKRLLLQREIKV